MIRNFCKNQKMNLNVVNYDVTFVSPVYQDKSHGDGFYKYWLNI